MSSNPLSASDRARIIELYQSDGVFAYPTEAVWGLGCNPFNRVAVERILALKKRPENKGLIVVAAELSQLETHLKLTPEMVARITTPQERSTTWLVPCSDSMPSWVRGAHTQVAVRFSTHPLVKLLCQSVAGPIISTSANPAGLAEALSEAEAKAYFGREVGCYVRGSLGDDPRPSQIIDSQTGAILRR
jgi:L-threonylcarbamoyladenylate synthase